jgi:hypothetical protein
MRLCLATLVALALWAGLARPGKSVASLDPIATSASSSTSRCGAQGLARALLDATAPATYPLPSPVADDNRTDGLLQR